MDREFAKRLVTSLPLLEGVQKVEALNEGYSDDKKYVLWRSGRPELLLRLSDSSYRVRRQTDFEILGLLSEAGILCSQPYQSGVTEDGAICYSILSYIPGQNAETALPGLTPDRQHEVGRSAGWELRKIHEFRHPKQGEDYSLLRVDKYHKQRQELVDLGITFPHQRAIEEYISDRLSLLGAYSVGLQHDDFHAANLIVRDGKFVGIIDFNRCDWGDPIEDFKKAPWFSAPISLQFARGQIEGYLETAEVPGFWLRYNLFVAMNFHPSLVWSARYQPSSTQPWLRRIKEIVETHDFETDGPPAWFSEDIELLPLNG